MNESTSAEQMDNDPTRTVAASAAVSTTFLKAKEMAPLFSLPDESGNRHSLSELLKHGPAVLSFHRGTWCSFCSDALSALAEVSVKITALGAGLLVIVPQADSAAGSPYLSSHTPYISLIDSGLKVAKEYGLTFDLPIALRAHYELNGYVPIKSGTQSSWPVPVPATYVVAQDGRIAMAFLDLDYRQAIDLEYLLSALQTLQKQRSNA
jgi:peroxiredoxin